MNRTKEQVKEGNKLIDKFCDNILQQRNVELDYHLNWNHLHMAFERFEEYLYQLFVYGEQDHVDNFLAQHFNFYVDHNRKIYVRANIHVLWKGLVEFIQWKNGNK